MKLIQLFESYDFLKQFTQVSQDCKPFLQDINHNSSFRIARGSKRIFENIQKQTSRLENRVPSHTPMDVHNKMNVILNDKFGHPFRNGVFGTGDVIGAKAYGRVYSMLPIGNYEFIWSSTIKDLFEEWLDLHDMLDSKAPEALYKKIKKAYKNTNIIHAIKSHNEIMLWCKQYYLVPMIIYNDRDFKEIVFNETD